MQSLISNGCVKQILFVCCTYKEQYKVYKQHPKFHKLIYVDFRKIRNKYHQIWITVDGAKCDTKFDCRLKVEKQIVLHSNKPGPAPSLATNVC
jgi:hypothetical protein